MRYIHTISEQPLSDYQSRIIEIASEESDLSNCIYITNANPIGTNRFDVLVSDSCILFLQYINLDNKNAFTALVSKIPTLIDSIGNKIYAKLSTHRGLTLLIHWISLLAFASSILFWVSVA